MSESHHPELRQLDLFADMDDARFDELMHASYVQNFPPQVELVSEGDPSDFLHVLLSGSVELFSHWNRRETTMQVLRPVTTFILAATIRDAPYLMSARTLEKSRVVLLPSQDVRAVFMQDAEFARSMVSELAQCYRVAIKSQKDLKLRTSLERLANYLLRQQTRADGAVAFDLAYEKRRLASYLGMTPENLSRAFRGLQSYGVEVDGTRIAITERDKLERFAKPDPLIDDRTT